MDRPRRSDCTAGQMDGEAGWWTTSGNIGLPPLARVMGVGRQQQQPDGLVPKSHSLHEVGMLQTSAQIVSTQPLPPEMGARFRFLGKPAVAPCRLAGFAPHKSRGRRVKSWPDDTNKHSPPALSPAIWICGLCHKQINKPQSDVTTHTGLI